MIPLKSKKIRESFFAELKGKGIHCFICGDAPFESNHRIGYKYASTDPNFIPWCDFCVPLINCVVKNHYLLQTLGVEVIDPGYRGYESREIIEVRTNVWEADHGTIFEEVLNTLFSKEFKL